MGDASVRADQVVNCALGQGFNTQERSRVLVLILIPKINLIKICDVCKKIRRNWIKCKNIKMKSVETQGERGCTGVESL